MAETMITLVPSHPRASMSRHIPDMLADTNETMTLARTKPRTIFTLSAIAEFRDATAKHDLFHRRVSYIVELLW